MMLLNFDISPVSPTDAAVDPVADPASSDRGTVSAIGPEKLFKIGEVMRYSGLSRQTLHNYTMMGLIAESERTDSGHRLYPASVFQTLVKIDLLKRHRPLREVRALLDAERTAPVGENSSR